MERTLRLSLNQFENVPDLLRPFPEKDLAYSGILVNLANLYHQYYLDSYNSGPPNPDPATFEHLRFLAATSDFRLLGDGIGVHPGIRRHKSNELGQAFCRVFLHDYMRITYFAHMAHVLGRSSNPPFRSVSVERVQEGDAPDYLCASASSQVYLAEAKGRYSSISFASREFDSWRRQFCRITVKNPNGQKRSVKGFIVATRFGTEDHPRVNSQIFAEDPERPGEEALDEESTATLQRQIARIHYGGVASKLNQHLLAAALLGGFPIPEELQFPATVWELRLGPLAGSRFVGGYFSPLGQLQGHEENRGIVFVSSDPFRLDVGRGTFFGLEEAIFKHLTQMARLGPEGRVLLRPYESGRPFYSAVSIMRDGTILAPLEFLAAVQQVVL